MSAVFLTRVGSAGDHAAAELLVESIRGFGGEMRTSAVLVCVTDRYRQQLGGRRIARTEPVALTAPRDICGFPFVETVIACAQAEADARADVDSLIWMDPSCLVVAPPTLLDLGPGHDAAFRPVHVGNVGLSPDEPLDPFWNGICSRIGIRDVPGTVTSFVDSRPLRTYFNSHGFSVNPRLGLLGRWRERFEELVRDRGFLESACSDEAHRIFLFQAVLSALAASTIDPARLRILPPTYNYPWHLHDRVPGERRTADLADLACLTYDEPGFRHSSIRGIAIAEPLASWLRRTCP